VLASDIATYISTSTLGLTAGTNVFAIPFPESTAVADRAVCVIEYPGEAPEHAAGASLSAPLYERPRFQVVVRDATSAAQACRDLAESVYRLLDGLADTTLSGTRYMQVRALQSPFYLSIDGQHRHRFVCNYAAEKARG
jgi:hypothetical protein